MSEQRETSMMDDLLDHIITTCSTPERTEKIVDRVLWPVFQNLYMRLCYLRFMFHGLTVLMMVNTALLIIILFMVWHRHGLLEHRA